MPIIEFIHKSDFVFPRKHIGVAANANSSGHASKNEEFEFNWQKLKSAIQDIHLKNTGALTFEQLYRHGYKIVLLKLPLRLYDNVKAFEEEWFDQHVMPPILDVMSSNSVNTIENTTAIQRRANGEKFLKVIRESWEQHNTAMNMIADILMYLDRGWSQEQNRPGIFAATIGLFRDKVLRRHLQSGDGTISSVLNGTIIDAINMEREGDAIDKSLIRSCTGMLESLHQTDEEHEDEKLYLVDFEPEYLESSQDYYKAECEKLLQEGDACVWLQYTQRRLEEEADRCITTVSPMTKDRIAAVIDHNLIKTHLVDFMNLEGSGFRAMVNNDRANDLTILYHLVCRVDTKREALRKALSDLVVELGYEIEKVLRNTDFSFPQKTDEEPAAEGEERAKPKALNAAAQQTAAALKWISDVLDLKDRFDRLWKDCFAEDLILQTALTKSYAEFINRFDRSAEYLSLFIDDNLKRGSRERTDAEIDANLERAKDLLRYISDKDKFELYYQKHLAKRLLQQKSEVSEKEEHMLSRMKLELGNNFTQKFEGMFKDLQLSKVETTKFSDHLKKEALERGATGEKRAELSVNILGGNNWPKEIMGRQNSLDGQERTDIIFPQEIKATQDSFATFYSSNHQGRMLTWVGSAGSAEIRCVFPKIPGKTSGPLSRERRYELSVTTYGMIVLMLFNDLPEGEYISFEDVQARTNIPRVDLINVLTSLSVMKTTKVLLKEPATKAAVKLTDKFTYNREFVSKSIKIKMTQVNAASKAENDDERKQTDEKATETRKYIIDAAIVRIMKARKEAPHAQVITQVIEQLSRQFKPDINLIKSRIEDLIGREYLERADVVDGKPAYRYLA
ncbi:cullin-3 [Truncatella angustata]|uniref:Cullin-3 n=1 Tax=Truncatella angustata TaxID=152316 RepID=A0A9P8UYD8_9PEZI|nr:cullin-3 [Truncatella angustata]KAH6660643.1 cullin-3 [Truncatella angustata]